MKQSTILLSLIIILLGSCDNSESRAKANQQPVEVADDIVTSSSPSEIDNEINTKDEAIQPGPQVDVNMDVFDPDFINGRWEAEEQNGYSFGAWFDSDEGRIIGQYCAMNHDATRIDCGTHDEVESCYLKSGHVAGKQALELEVVSCYALKKGKATLTLQGDGHLIWRLVEEPGEYEVDHFAPKEALLRKVSFDPYE